MRVADHPRWTGQNRPFRRRADVMKSLAKSKASPGLVAYCIATVTVTSPYRNRQETGLPNLKSPFGWCTFWTPSRGFSRGFEGHRGESSPKQQPARIVKFRPSHFSWGYWSGRLDSNQRPPAPKAGALPGCATPRLKLPKDSTRSRARIGPSVAELSHGGDCLKPPGSPSPWTHR